MAANAVTVVNAVKPFFGSLTGPATVVAAGAMGAGSVATLLLAGAWFRYDLLWVVVFTLPFLVIAVDSSSRIGSVNQGQGMLSIMRRHIHPSVAWLLLLIVVPVHLLVAMGQFSVMTSACLSLFGVHPPPTNALPEAIDRYFRLELAASVLLAVAVLWLVLFRGYGRMQKVMTYLLVLMFLCFFALAIRSIADVGAIAAGLVPRIPPDVPIAGRSEMRLSSTTIIAIVGAAIAPGGLLAMPYLSSDARRGRLDLKGDFRKSVVSLGLIFGAYSAFILIAGGFALYPLAHHAEIETVHEAGQVLDTALYPGIRALGPLIFSAGLLIAAMTTMIVSVQVIIYTSLDMLRQPWSFSGDNHLYRRLLVVITLGVSIAAPLWSFPAMLKVLLLMGVNVLVVPIVITALFYLINRREVMGDYTANPVRNLMLAGCIGLSVLLAIQRGPDLLQMLAR